MAKTYTAEHHQQAFELWYEFRNWSHIAKEMGMEWSTAKRWAADDFECKWNCAWHNWPVLADEKDKAQQTRAALLQANVVDPVAHDEAMRGVLVNKVAQPSEVVTFLRSDAERIAQWEYLWSKVYYTATGIVLDWRQLKSADIRDPKVEEQMRATLRTGLSPTSLDQCIKMLKTIQDQIQEIRGDVGSDRSDKEAAAKEIEDVSIDELRKLRQLAKDTPKSKIDTMLTIVDAEDAKPESAAS